MRGKGTHPPKEAQRGRITPAHAGKSKVIVVLFKVSKDHPRTCGEKKAFIDQGKAGKGSPPHMRGKD